MDDLTKLTDADIDAVWQVMNGDKEWLRTFGYQQFARALLSEAAQRPPIAYDDLFDVVRGTGYVTTRQTREICGKIMEAIAFKASE